MKVEDIAGTRSRPRVFNRPRMTDFSTLEYSDVTKKTNLLNRHTNPLMPTYTIKDDDGIKTCEIGPISGSRPARLPSAPKDKNRNAETAAGSKGFGIFSHVDAKYQPCGENLNTKDIEGAQASTKGLGIFAHVTRKDQPGCKNLNTKDIYGA